MAHSRPWSTANPDLRRRTQLPAPPIAEIEQRILAMLTPHSFKPLKGELDTHGKILRNSKLNLSVMVAVVLSLVCRQIPSLSELLRVLHHENLLWVEAMHCSQSALSKRLERIPCKLFSEAFEQMLALMDGSKRAISAVWQPIVQEFTAIWIADGSTLEELRRQTKELRQEQKTVLAGKMMAMVELLSHRPVYLSYVEKPKANDKSFCQQLLEKLPIGGLLVFDLGFFKFLWFDQFTEGGKYFVTRLREKTSYRSVKTYFRGERYRDELIELGTYRSNPCRHPVRLVSVLWDTTWYCYLTNVLDPAKLPPHLVCELYRRRWRIEDAFALTKRLLGLSYIWVGSRNGVQIQIYATWIIYAMLNQLCTEVAIALNQPLEQISVEMVFRGLYHYAQASLKGIQESVVDYLVREHRILSLVKNVRKRHRQRDGRLQEIWGFSILTPCPISESQ
jgi:hypothetical protein